MSAVAVQMEVEEGANATVTELLAALLEEEELGLPRATQEILREGVISVSSAKGWTQSIKSTLGRSDSKHYLLDSYVIRLHQFTLKSRFAEPIEMNLSLKYLDDFSSP